MFIFPAAHPGENDAPRDYSAVRSCFKFNFHYNFNVLCFVLFIRVLFLQRWKTLTLSHVSLKYSDWPQCVTLWFPWWRVIACHVTHRSNNRAEWMMICFYVIFPFLFKIFTNLLDMAWNIWYSDCQIYASGSVLLFKHLYNDRVSWAVCAMGAAMLVCAADAVQRIGSVGFTTREFIHFSRNT